MGRTGTSPNVAASNGSNDSSYSLRRVSTSREIRPPMDTSDRPSFIHRSRSHIHDYRHGISHLFNSRSGSPTAGPTLSSATKIEEEKNPRYNPNAFYPAKIDEILNERYKILTKLGYGMTATVWLAQDLRASPQSNRKYVTIKISVNTLGTDYVLGRRKISEKLATANPKHPGYEHVRFSFDSFKIKGLRHGIDRFPEHLCVVYDVLREPIDVCMQKWPKRRFNGQKLRILLPSLLNGLDYLHSECRVVHTDLKADNIMMGLGNPKVLEEFVQYQYEHPPPRKMPDHHGRIIYQSCSDFGQAPTDEVIKSAKITDIGLAEWGDEPNNKPIQSNAFTAPEVILTAGWSYPADIWNLGVMIWDLIEDDGLFDCIPTEPGKYSSMAHLGVMIGLLGPPPKELLERGSTTATYFDENGEFRKPEAIKRSFSFEDTVRSMKGEEKDLFIDLAKKMVAWLPEERWTAKQLLDHPFLTKTEFAMPDPSHDEQLSRDLIEQFAVSRPRSMTVTPQLEPSPSPPGGSPPARTPNRTPEPSIKSLSISGRTNTNSTLGSMSGFGITPLARTSSNLSTSSCNAQSQDIIDNILRPAKAKSGTSTPAIQEEPHDMTP